MKGLSRMNGYGAAWFVPGGAGGMDGERGPGVGAARPEQHAAEDTLGVPGELLHPAGLSLHFRRQAHGHHSAGKHIQPEMVFPIDVCVRHSIPQEFIHIRCQSPEERPEMFDVLPPVCNLRAVILFLFPI